MIERINPPPKKQMKSEESEEEPYCNNCRSYKQQFFESEQKNVNLQLEVNRLTNKIDNIRRLQEIGAINSMPSTMKAEEEEESDAVLLSRLELKGTGPSISDRSQGGTSDTDVVIQKIRYYTTELHGLLDVLESKPGQSGIKK